MKNTLPPNTILFISGASGIGKTTTSQILLKRFSSTAIIEQVDLIREVIRGYSNYWSKEIQCISCPVLSAFLSKQSIIFKSTSELSLNEIQQQSQLCLPSIKNICQRLRDKGTPAIIEGTNIIFSQLLIDRFYLEEKNILVVKLYLSNADIHKNRLNRRFAEQNRSMISKESFNNIRVYNDFLKVQTDNLKKESSPVLSKRILKVNAYSEEGIKDDVIERIESFIKTNLLE